LETEKILKKRAGNLHHNEEYKGGVGGEAK